MSKNKQNADAEEPQAFLELSEEIPEEWKYAQATHAEVTDSASVNQQLPIHNERPLVSVQQNRVQLSAGRSHYVAAGMVVGGVLLLIPISRVIILGLLYEILLLMRIFAIPLLVVWGLWMVYQLFYARR